MWQFCFVFFVLLSTPVFCAQQGLEMCADPHWKTLPNTMSFWAHGSWIRVDWDQPTKGTMQVTRRFSKSKYACTYVRADSILELMVYQLESFIYIHNRSQTTLNFMKVWWTKDRWRVDRMKPINDVEALSAVDTPSSYALSLDAYGLYAQSTHGDRLYITPSIGKRYLYFGAQYTPQIYAPKLERAYLRGRAAGALNSLVQLIRRALLDELGGHVKPCPYNRICEFVDQLKSGHSSYYHDVVLWPGESSRTTADYRLAKMHCSAMGKRVWADALCYQDIVDAKVDALLIARQQPGCSGLPLCVRRTRQDVGGADNVTLYVQSSVVRERSECACGVMGSWSEDVLCHQLGVGENAAAFLCLRACRDNSWYSSASLYIQRTIHHSKDVAYVTLYAQMHGLSDGKYAPLGPWETIGSWKACGSTVRAKAPVEGLLGGGNGLACSIADTVFVGVRAHLFAQDVVLVVNNLHDPVASLVFSQNFEDTHSCCYNIQNVKILTQSVVLDDMVGQPPMQPVPLHLSAKPFCCFDIRISKDAPPLYMQYSMESASDQQCWLNIWLCNVEQVRSKNILQVLLTQPHVLYEDRAHRPDGALTLRVAPQAWIHFFLRDGVIYSTVQHRETSWGHCRFFEGEGVMEQMAGFPLSIDHTDLSCSQMTIQDFGGKWSVRRCTEFSQGQSMMEREESITANEASLTMEWSMRNVARDSRLACRVCAPCDGRTILTYMHLVQFPHPEDNVRQCTEILCKGKLLWCEADKVVVNAKEVLRLPEGDRQGAQDTRAISEVIVQNVSACPKLVSTLDGVTLVLVINDGRLLYISPHLAHPLDVSTLMLRECFASGEPVGCDHVLCQYP